MARDSLGLREDEKIILYAFDGASYLARKNPFALIRCFAGCRISAIVAALGLTMPDLFTGPTVPRARRIVEATYDYIGLDVNERRHLPAAQPDVPLEREVDAARAQHAAARVDTELAAPRARRVGRARR